MIREKYQLVTRETSCSVVQSHITSIRRKNITKTGYRVYKDGRIGVYGQLGSGGAIAETDLLGELEDALATARQAHPDFILSNKINLTETIVTLSNDQGTHLRHREQVLLIGLMIKHKDSVQIIDASLYYQTRRWDRAFFLKELDRITRAYQTEVALPEGELLVVADPGLVARKLVSELNGEKVGYKSSLLQDRFGQAAFNEDFSFYLDFDPAEQFQVPFFDAEGTVMPGGRADLIRRGVVVSAYTDKRTAARFQMPLTGSAACAYDGVPTLGAGHFGIEPGRTVKEMLDGRMGLVIAMASGGDYTEDGRFATPVQLGLLTDGENLLGRLPPCHVSGHLFDLFGQDYVGYSGDRFLTGDRALVLKMTVTPG